MLITHQKNIERLLKKEESKMFSFKKKAIWKFSKTNFFFLRNSTI
jgi:hypothetical protein